MGAESIALVLSNRFSLLHAGREGANVRDHQSEQDEFTESLVSLNGSEVLELVEAVEEVVVEEPQVAELTVSRSPPRGSCEFGRCPSGDGIQETSESDAVRTEVSGRGVFVGSAICNGRDSPGTTHQQ